jgi:hypothetical protein
MHGQAMKCVTTTGSEQRGKAGKKAGSSGEDRQRRRQGHRGEIKPRTQERNGVARTGWQAGSLQNARQAD